MKSTLVVAAVAAILWFIPAPDRRQNNSAKLWPTTADRSALFQKQKQSYKFLTGADPQQASIEIFDHRLQSIDGFGFALTWGSAQHFYHMEPAKRKALLKELFGTNANSMGISCLRVSIGASDLNEYVYCYDDLPAGETDLDLKQFSLKDDEKYVIPVLILAIRPDMKSLGSPWSAPAWMKNSSNVKGGGLKPEYYQPYANYFVKYIQGMQARGIRIDAITIQNEPLNEKNTPSMQMSAPEQAAFLKGYLGPAFKAAAGSTRVLLYDHNCDLPSYPMEILSDPQTNPHADGSAFHLYKGNISTMSEVHEAYPKKYLCFTEYMAVEKTDKSTLLIAKHVFGTVSGAVRNWSRNVLLWNLAADSKFEPRTDNGECPVCQGAVTIDGNEVTRNLAYYTIAHFSKFVHPGSVRINSNSPDTLANAAFQTPKHTMVLVVADTGPAAQTLNVKYRGKLFAAKLESGAVGTLVW